MHPLISPAELAPHLDDPAWVVFDCRHAPAAQPPEATGALHGYEAYRQGHLQGARFADMEEDLAGPVGPGTGRHPLPDWEAFRRWLSGQGVTRGSTVVAYDDASGAWAARLWWMLTALGHERVAVLNGGIARWRREGRLTDKERVLPRAMPYDGSSRPSNDGQRLAPLAEVQAKLDDPGLLLVDARAAERYRGESEPLDPRAGHIPGAINLPFMDNVDADGVFLSPERLRERLLAAFGDTPPERTVHYCGSGVTACHNLLAQAAAGLPPGRLYAGSWSQWCADPARPVALGVAARG